MTKEKKQFAVTVAPEACKGCGYCQELCPKGVYVLGAELNAAGYIFMTVEDQERCIGCLSCVMGCPDFAISVEDR
jgi:NAD-dependent dihydropyrimidine dehydrogenase PreA subunit